MTHLVPYDGGSWFFFRLLLLMQVTWVEVLKVMIFLCPISSLMLFVQESTGHFILLFFSMNDVSQSNEVIKWERYFFRRGDNQLQEKKPTGTRYSCFLFILMGGLKWNHRVKWLTLDAIEYLRKCTRIRNIKVKKSIIIVFEGCVIS